MRPPRERGSPGPSTLAVHAGAPPSRVDEPVVQPVVTSATFFMAAEPSAPVRYTRYGTNPSHVALCRKLAALEGAEAALVTGSGMGAIAMAMLALLRSGDHVVAARSLYGGTLALLGEELPRLGIETTFVPEDGWEAALRPETRLLWLELPSNPLLRVIDPRPLACLARERGARLVVDATFATPVNCRPLEHGADLVVHSGTKYLGGHSDLTAGVIAGPQPLVEEARRRLIHFGPVLDPGAAARLERGVKTLPLRVERHNRNALELAAWLQTHPAVARVHYPGLDSHPDHALARELFDGFGGMLALEVHGGDPAALAALRRLRTVRLAPSLGSVESLVSMPLHTSHAGLSDAERRASGIGPGLIRLSVGVEDVADLRADLAQALEAGE